MNNKKIKTKGFGLIEMLVTLGIALSLGLILSHFQFDVFRQNYFIQESLLANQVGRTAIKNFMTEMRSAVPSNTGTYPISLADGERLTFFTNPDGDNLYQRVRYYLSDGVLYRGYLEPTGSPPSYVETNEKISIVATGILNSTGTATTTVFTYFPTGMVDLATRLVPPVNIADIRLVTINLLIDNNDKRSPEPLNFITHVVPRNLRDY